MIKYLLLVPTYLFVCFLILVGLGEHGIIGDWINFESLPWVKYIIFMVAMTHITITAMSLSFHRYHTHMGIIINKYLDSFFQIWLWLFTSMSKLDWVSVHIYHHANSDKPKDPHSPVQKGLLRVFFGGTYDYNRAKKQEDVMKLRNTIKTNALEKFMDVNYLLGPILTTFAFLILLGPIAGTICLASCFMISPIFAVGGVNALAHYYGYRNHNSGDNSRNLGFLIPLNFLLCGELDHNNHHKYPRSCSFRHKWYEFDYGYIYIKILSKLNLVEVKNLYTVRHFKKDLRKKLIDLINNDVRVVERLKVYADELNMTVEEIKKKISDFIEGHKTDLEIQLRDFVRELKKATKGPAFVLN
ncbi:MAG: fatty acid desaturase [Halobacteriovoraceae bacterium]|nr:fatty acid desaturase [Halobacteriovoraceae bacterium]MCB9093772.1 fatty acid desaturase [Halobacteriovoraceae bacterium]